MGQIIASTYEIVENIGSGGGGVVYRARHLRLDKWVVLKADRRSLSAKPEKLRREVDSLKNLSHTYIPQVYDFFVENDTVYTVMDYIEGESADKPLHRGERFSQVQVIEWACQLLEAVQYLHSRPPHGILHSDIKPSNIMLTPQGDIRLIDFNIALALGEDGAVRAGYSRGYASPEHYGATEFPEEETLEETEVMSGQKTAVETEQFKTVVMRQPDQFSSATAGKNVMLDVRSDIYSIGATLYHMLTGRKPARLPKDIQPIGMDEASAGVAAIIMKALSLAPDDRYQSAEEMLYAFRHLRENDLRTKRHKRRCIGAGAVVAAAFLVGAVTTFVGLKQMERTQNAHVMAEYSANALEQGNVDQAVSYAMSALPTAPGILDAQPIPEAQRALSAALGVYNLADGFKQTYAIELTQEPLKFTMSPTGSRIAVLTTGKVSVFDTKTGLLQAELMAYPSVYSDLVFGGEDLLYFAGADGVVAYDLANAQTLWQGDHATAISLSADGRVLATVFEDENQAMIYDTATGEIDQIVPFRGNYQRTIQNNVFADTESSLFVLDATGRYLAVSFHDGALQIFDLENPGQDFVLFETSTYNHFEGGFSGDYFAFSATDSKESLFVVIDMVQGAQTGGFASEQTFHVKTDENGIYLNMQNVLVQIDPVTGAQRELVFTDSIIDAFSHAGQYTLTAHSDGGYAFYDGNGRLMESHSKPEKAELIQIAGECAVVANRSEATVRVMKLELNEQARLAMYDPAFDHYEARMNSKGDSAMLYRFDAFRIVRTDGDIIAEVALPDGMDVYDQQYRRGEQGDYLEVVYNDGLVRCYSAGDGSLISEEQGEVPDSSLEEEFFTDRYRIVAPVHGAPSVYDRQSGELVALLETDDFLTYVTQTGEYIVTEYTNAQGERYGLLLDGALHVLADLPGLCDILPDGRLVFDDLRGKLRVSEIYSLAQLQSLGMERMG